MTDRLDIETITVGQELSPINKYMTQEKINTYISAAEDYNPIHTDPEYAKNTAFKSTIAPGYQFIAYLSELMARDFGEKWITAGGMELRLIRPVFPKDTLSVGAKVVEKRKEGGNTFIKCDVWIKNQVGNDIVAGYTTVAC
ncbi:MaoC-like protein [uncultured Desulfobacterium sp.]|uniref:MaoC-like protein n=1 Tax=uncultured Desulfobacterium sp. TaxID=201089 RepID=A0A445MVT9_9BACT|nr:MaoC-like protein [uncultured Desulfobacterium sp.]